MYHGYLAEFQSPITAEDGKEIGENVLSCPAGIPDEDRRQEQTIKNEANGRIRRSLNRAIDIRAEESGKNKADFLRACSPSNKRDSLEKMLGRFSYDEIATEANREKWNFLFAKLKMRPELFITFAPEPWSNWKDGSPVKVLVGAHPGGYGAPFTDHTFGKTKNSRIFPDFPLVVSLHEAQAVAELCDYWQSDPRVNRQCSVSYVSAPHDQMAGQVPATSSVSEQSKDDSANNRKAELDWQLDLTTNNSDMFVLAAEHLDENIKRMTETFPIEKKKSVQKIVGAIVAVGSVFSNPYAGAISDRLFHSCGKELPKMVFKKGNLYHKSSIFELDKKGRNNCLILPAEPKPQRLPLVFTKDRIEDFGLVVIHWPPPTNKPQVVLMLACGLGHWGSQSAIAALTSEEVQFAIQSLKQSEKVVPHDPRFLRIEKPRTLMAIVEVNLDQHNLPVHKLPRANYRDPMSVEEVKPIGWRFLNINL